MPDIACEDIRSSVKAIAKIMGHIDIEDVLDVVFSEFCVGK